MVLSETATSNGMQSILDKANISYEIATEERERWSDLITEYSDIFFKDDQGIASRDIF